METIICAAIHYDNGIEYHHQKIYGINTGFVLAGYRHHFIVEILPTNVHFKRTDNGILEVDWDGTYPKHKTTQGFLTSTGRFVDRKGAAIIALASGQIKRLNYSETELYSEDLY